MYAYVTSDTIQAVGRIPNAARRLDTGQWVLGLPDAPAELQAATGWLPVTDVARPADTDTHTHDRSVTLVAGVPTVTWTQRAWTTDEVASRIDADNYVDPAAQVALIAELFVAADVKAGALTNDEVAKRAPLFPSWKPGIAVAVGDVYRWDGTLVEVLQSHTTQADWSPDVVPALFKIHRTAAVAPWVQPVGAHDAYRLGERVTHNGSTWESVNDANVWAPPTQWVEVV